MQRILPIHVGGTIASAGTGNGFRPQLSFSDLLVEIDQPGGTAHHIAPAQAPFGEFGIDSASMQISHIHRIATTILNNYDNHDAFLVTHGTDTLAYTASLLSFMLRGIQKTVIVTGAQRTLEDDNSDVSANLETALVAASTSNYGVWVAFNGEVINGARATKIDIGVDCLAAFTSNIRTEIPVASFQQNDCSINKGEPETFCTEISEAVDIYSLTHTTTPVVLENYLRNSGLKALIVLVYGMSGHRLELIQVLSRYAGDNDAVVIAKSHAPYGSTDLSKYELGIKALQMGILSALDMTLESVYAKTCTVLSRCSNQREFCEQFYTNYCGELDEVTVQKFLERAAFWGSAS